MQNKIKKLGNSFKYAINGIKLALKTERNFKIHFIIMILVIIMGFFFQINKIEWIICIILFGVVISAELMNTAIEKLTDIAMPQINEKAKLIKDVAAAGVLVVAISSAIVGIMIFLPKVFKNIMLI